MQNSAKKDALNMYILHRDKKKCVMVFNCTVIHLFLFYEETYRFHQSQLEN